VRIAVITYHVPHPNGTAAGRQLWAWADAAIAAGHVLVGWCWGPLRPGVEPPSWCRWEPFTAPVGWRVKPRTLLRPRTAIATAGWQAPEDTTAVWVDDWGSFPAAADAAAPSVLTVHYSVAVDACAARTWSPAQVQDWRAQRRAIRRANVAVALSDRVRASVGAAQVVPATAPLPTEALPLVDEPVALMLAHWAWPANRIALTRLLRDWPEVRRRVPGATLLIAGRGLGPVGASAGVRVLGEVADPVDAMAQAAVLAFPCPPTSGPKIKVLDALLHGLPVVTTSSGLEGLSVDDSGAFRVRRRHFCDGLVDVLRDPGRRADVAARGRVAALEWHAPAVAAAARVRVLERAVS
jgi:hypothetical protein